MSGKRNKAQRRVAHLSARDPYKWTPLKEGPPRGDLKKVFDERLDGQVFSNDRYTVLRRDYGQFIHLSIRRNDRDVCHDWRDFQRIKNELAGPEWEAVELYPAESRLVDTSNQYHLWCVNERLDFGWQERCVSDKYAIAGTRQRPLPDDWEQTSDTDFMKIVQGVMDVREKATHE